MVLSRSRASRVVGDMVAGSPSHREQPASTVLGTVLLTRAGGPPATSGSHVVALTQSFARRRRSLILPDPALQFHPRRTAGPRSQPSH